MVVVASVTPPISKPQSAAMVQPQWWFSFQVKILFSRLNFLKLSRHLYVGVEKFVQDVFPPQNVGLERELDRSRLLADGSR